MYFRKIPTVLYSLFPQCIWQIPNADKKVFLTFDDGPTQVITEKTLAILSQYEVKATFFMLGKQIIKNPLLAKEVLAAGHSIGNHSFSHLNGWQTANEIYFDDIQKAQDIFEESLQLSPTLFRPPYGKISLSQMKHVKNDYQIVMMDILCGDFDANQSAKTCTEIIQKHTKTGSIIVYHDSEKAASNMLSSLPETLAFLKGEGYEFGGISS